MAKKKKPGDPKKNGPNFRKRAKPGRPPAKKTQAPSRPTVQIVGMRLNKYIAHCGLTSRRQAADWVKAGRVSVNGKRVLEPYYQMQADDLVQVDGKAIQPETRQVYLLLNKPRGVITTVKDEKGRKTVLDLVGGSVSERIYPVGRLDRDTTGLLLLTNDGDLAQRLAHPRHQIKKVYQVGLDRPVSESDLEKIRRGLTLEDGPVEVDAVDYLEPDDPHRVAIELHIGRNRIVRRIFEQLGYRVEKLDRTFLGGLTKKDLPRGFHRHLTEREVIMLKHFS